MANNNNIIIANQCFVPKSREDEEEIEKCFKKYSKFVLTLPKEKGWSTEFMYKYKGIWFHIGLEGLLWMQDHFKPKSTDIFLMTFPKCEFELFDHPPLGDPDILPSPRILASHIPYNLLPNSILDSGCKMVYICRDPKDMFVSLWHFYNNKRWKSHGWAPIPMEEAVDMFCKGLIPRGSYWDFVLGYWRASLEFPEKLLFMKYEAMKEDELGQVKKLADFLGYPFTQQEEENRVIQEIVKLCSFKSLSSLQANKIGSTIRNSEETKLFFRKGEIGDSKNHLTRDMIELIDKVTKEKLSGTGFTFCV
ncbi:hypothetical protein ACFE04_027833 [Oxalis oulophora]